MLTYKKITEDMYALCNNDRRLALFENMYPLPNGVSYNSYFVEDDTTVLLDTVDKAVEAQFFANLEALLDGRALDYLIVNHMEPDHCACIATLLRLYPAIRIVCTAKTVTMIAQFFGIDVADRATVVKEGDTLSTGRHTFTFVMAPMVHWPEVMVTYDTTDKILYSADAFGMFGAVNGNIYDDETDTESRLPEIRRYYTNIVGKYGPQVQALLKKAAGLEISCICPLHGLLWRSNIGWIIEKYDRWSSYRAEENSVMIAYGSVYGNTAAAAELLAAKLEERGVKNIAVYDVSATDTSYIVSDAFRYGTLVFASSTYNNEIFPKMENLLLDLKAHNLRNRTVALLQNGSWAPTAGGKMRELLDTMKDITVAEETVTIRSALAAGQEAELDRLADALSGAVVQE